VLAALPGSLIAPKACQTLASGAGIARIDFPESGPVRLRLRSDAIVTPQAPISVRLSAARLSRLDVRFALDGRALRPTVTRTEQSLTLSPAALSRATTHRLTVELRRPNGTGRRLGMVFRTAPCTSRFSTAYYRTRSGTALRLRMDSNRALAGAAFTVPAPLALRGGAKTRLAGRLRFVVAPGRSRVVRLTLPARSRSGTLLSGRSGPGVRFDNKGFAIQGLPAGTGIVELTIFGRASATAPPGRSYAFGARITPFG